MARPTLGEGKSVRLHMMITQAECDAIDNWRLANHVPSFSEAVRQLVAIGIPARGTPGLLEATKQAERFLDSLSNSYEVCGHTQALIDTVKAAIAKAEGRQQ